MVSAEKGINNQCICLDSLQQIWDKSLGRCICNVFNFKFPQINDAGIIICSSC